MVNQRKVYNRRNEVLKIVRPSSRLGSYSNCVRINPNNSLIHERKKLEVCYELIKAGCEVFTEVEFYGGICDILSIDKNGNPLIYEIVVTESKESLEAKKLKYPFEIVEIKA
jgi:hypothetical protein